MDLVPSEEEVYSRMYTIYFWAAVPLLTAVAIVMLVLRPIYVLALCDLYSDHLEKRNIPVELPENPSRGVSAVIAFVCVCFILAIAYVYRVELDILDMLSTPYGP